MITKYECELVKNGVVDYDGPVSAENFEEIYEVLKAARVHKKAEEHIVMMTFDQGMKVTGFFELAHGSADGATLFIRDLMKRAILINASGIVISHNHPSNSVMPTVDDIEITKDIVRACKYFDIALVDHVIVCRQEGKYYSMRDRGMIFELEDEIAEPPSQVRPEEE